MPRSTLHHAAATHAAQLLCRVRGAAHPAAGATSPWGKGGTRAR